MMNDFILINKIRDFTTYVDQYIFSSFPKSGMALKIKIEEHLFLLVENAVKANVNVGNIRRKYQVDLIANICLLDFYVGIVHEKGIITEKRFDSFLEQLNTIKKISIKWMNNETKK